MEQAWPDTHALAKLRDVRHAHEVLQQALLLAGCQASPVGQRLHLHTPIHTHTHLPIQAEENFSRAGRVKVFCSVLCDTASMAQALLLLAH
jgi:hypothetical protein